VCSPKVHHNALAEAVPLGRLFAFHTPYPRRVPCGAGRQPPSRALQNACSVEKQSERANEARATLRSAADGPPDLSCHSVAESEASILKTGRSRRYGVASR